MCCLARRCQTVRLLFAAEIATVRLRHERKRDEQLAALQEDMRRNTDCVAQAFDRYVAQVMFACDT